jgi:hypothetical protein
LVDTVFYYVFSIAHYSPPSARNFGYDLHVTLILQPHNPQQKIIRVEDLTSPPLPPLQNRICYHIREIHPAVIPHNTISVVSYPIIDRESASHECNALILSNRRAFCISKQNIQVLHFFFFSFLFYLPLAFFTDARGHPGICYPGWY